MYNNVANGLKMMFVSAIVSIFASIFTIIPFIGIIGAIAVFICSVISLLGLFIAGKDVREYKTAFLLNIINIVVSLLINIKGGFGDLMSIVSTVITLIITYIVITTTSSVMRNTGNYEIAEYGDNVWKLYFGCEIVAIICGLIAFIPVLNLIAGLVAFITAIVTIVASIKYLIYLFKSYTVLGA